MSYSYRRVRGGRRERGRRASCLTQPDPASPQVGHELRRLREAAGLTGDQVIERIGWASASKLSRLENGRSRPDPQDVLDLLDLYGADEALREELLGITQEAATCVAGCGRSRR